MSTTDKPWAPALLCMSIVIVTAIDSFPYGDRMVERGDRVEMPPIDAVVLARQRKVSLSRGYQARVLESEPAVAEPEPKPKRRRYRRRDLTAETS